MAGVLRHSCTSCARYLSPARNSRSLHEETRYTSFTPPTRTPPTSPIKRTETQPNTSIENGAHHTRSRSAGFISKNTLTSGHASLMQVKTYENARQMSSYKKPAIDIPLFLHILSVLNIDLPKHFPQIIKGKSYQSPVVTAREDVRDEKIQRTISKDDSLDNLLDAERKVEIECKKRILQYQEEGTREQHDLVDAVDGFNAVSNKRYFSSITFPDLKPKKDSLVSERGEKTEESKRPAEPKETKSEGNTSLVSGRLSQIRSYIPLGSSKESSPADKDKKKVAEKRPTLTQSDINRRTRGMVLSLKSSTEAASQLRRTEELCNHISLYPDSKSVALKEDVLPCLLKMRQSDDSSVQDVARQGLALIGYAPPVQGRGIRVLTLDGGGTKGLVSIDLLKKLEQVSGKRIHELFDYVCGVSTGSLIGILAVVHKLPMERIEKLYKEFSTKVFAQNKIYGISKLVTKQGYYDVTEWERILRKNMGEISFLDTMKDPTCPKISVVGCLTNRTKVENYLFRNYNHPVEAESYYKGSCKYKLWEAIRASSAAPTYFEEYKLDNLVLSDGGVLSNNPTSIAISESHDLWPSSPLQCVVSIGTGKNETMDQEPNAYSKINQFVDSATDTEAVHITMHRLLKPGTYFRFNPYLSENCNLDEISPEKWDLMKQDTNMYCRKNDMKIQKAVEQLLRPKLPHQRLGDWVTEYRSTHRKAAAMNN